MMIKKHCLFCNENATIERVGDIDHYSACMCTPEGYYALDDEAYSQIQAFSYEKKRRLMPIVSAYIREMSNNEDEIYLTTEEIEAIAISPAIPATVEEKGKRLLIYLYHHSDGANDPVNLHPLSQHFNLTYSPNLQEFVYIIERLKDSGMIEREGSVLKLLPLGWNEAMALAGGKKSKSCVVLLNDTSNVCEEWMTSVLPRIKQCGYNVLLLQLTALRRLDESILKRIADCKLMIADLTEAEPEIYFAAGYAERSKIPIIWTVRSDEVDRLHAQSEWIRPLIWDDIEQLLERLIVRL